MSLWYCVATTGKPHSGGTLMESYVVRIYRRDAASPQSLVGLVELVEVGKEKAFVNFAELRAILDSKQGHGAREERAGSKE